jgi:hypothetical protein
MNGYSKHNIWGQYSNNGSLYLQSTKGKEESDITKEDCELFENQPVTGGPKTSETPLEPTNSRVFKDEVDISKDLSTDQQGKLRAVLMWNQGAFTLDGRIGNYEESSTMISCPESIVRPSNQ